jgi:hypothetical protein
LGQSVKTTVKGSRLKNRYPHFRFGEVGPVLWRADHNLLSPAYQSSTKCGSLRHGRHG